MTTQQSALGLSKPFVVGVTGGGLYNSGFGYNSAAVMKDALPNHFQHKGRTDIRILKATENLPAEYAPSRQLIQGLWAGDLSMYDPVEEPIDGLEVRLMIHMGMRTKEPNYCFESIARRDGYIHPDNCGELPNTEDYQVGGYFEGCPETLRPALDIEAASKVAHELLPHKKMRVSTDAGHNLCEWFFYNSLAEGYKRGVPGNVAFVHVPPGRSEEDLKNGIEILQAYIGALVEQIESKAGLGDGTPESKLA